MRAIIEAHDLTKSYTGNDRAVDGLSFRVQPGEVYGLLGPNGAGKSSTVRMLATLSTPDHGRASVAGFDVQDQGDEVRRTIGYVAQRSGTDPEATGRENLHLQARIQGLDGPASRRRSAELLEQFGLEEPAERLVATYSGGMARRLDIAMGLVHGPRVIYLDEPTTGLDPEARSDLWAELDRLAAAEGISVLLTTHYLDEADRLADRIGIIDRGRLVAEGTPDALKADLDGDTVELVVTDCGTVADVMRLARRLEGAGVPTAEDNVVRVTVPAGARVLPPLLQALSTDGIAITAVTVSRPTLDDVYLRHAGRRFDATDQQESRT